MNKSKTKNKSRLSGWITGICIFLTVTLSVGFLSQLGPKKSNGSSGNGSGAGGDFSTDMPAAEFGGKLLNRVDFEGIEDYFFLNKYLILQVNFFLQ